MEGSATEEPKIIRRPAGMSDDEDYDDDDGDIIIEVEEDIWDDDDKTSKDVIKNAIAISHEMTRDDMR